MTRFARTFIRSLIRRCCGGQRSDRLNDSDALARLAFESSPVVQRGEVQQVCIAVTRDGEYRLIRSTWDKPTQPLRGQIAKEDFEKLKGLLTSPEFRSQASHGGALIRQEAESFRAEIPEPMRENADGTRERIERDAWRLQWLNADNTDPFPRSVTNVVSWLQNFQPKNGKKFFFVEFPDVCPSGGLRFVQPAVAMK